LLIVVTAAPHCCDYCLTHLFGFSHSAPLPIVLNVAQASLLIVLDILQRLKLAVFRVLQALLLTVQAPLLTVPNVPQAPLLNVLDNYLAPLAHCCHTPSSLLSRLSSLLTQYLLTVCHTSDPCCL